MQPSCARHGKLSPHQIVPFRPRARSHAHRFVSPRFPKIGGRIRQICEINQIEIEYWMTRYSQTSAGQ